jgi:hypothetical protein
VRELIVEERGQGIKPEFGRPGPPYEVPDWLDMPIDGPREGSSDSAPVRANQPPETIKKRSSETMREVSP